MAVSQQLYSQNSFQNWLTHQANHRINSQFEIYSDQGIRFILPSFSWVRLHLRPSGSYRLNQVIGFHAGLGFFQTFNHDAPNETELRPWQGIRLYGPRFGKFLIKHFIRFEQRIKWIQNDGRTAAALKIRYQISSDIPLKGNSIQVGTVYFPISIELFGNVGKDLEERFADRTRIQVGIGKRIKENLKLEVVYILQRSANTFENDNSNLDHIISIIIKNRHNYD